MTAKRRAGFRQVLKQVLEEDRPLSYSQLQGLSNPHPEDLCAWREGWPAAAPERRRQVVCAVAQLNEDNPDLNFRDILMVALSDLDETVRLAAIEGLGDDESLDLLETLLALAAGDPSPQVRSQALLALGRFVYLVETTDLLGNYRQRLLRLLLEIFDDTAAPLEVRRRAIEAVSYIEGRAEVEDAIHRAYGAAEREMHVSAIHAMGHHMDERWQPLIERELASNDPEMRYEAACACGEMGNPELVHHLMPLLEDEDHEVARAAIWALGEIGGTQARRLLERCLQNGEDDIREAAGEALYTLQFFEDPMRML
jgi:HEAT repeat protein